MKWLGDKDDLGIQLSSTFGTCSSFSKIEANTLRKVGSKEKLALKLCNVSPPSNSITNLAPYQSTGSKATMVDFHSQICNLCMSRVNAHNVHHPKPPYSKY